MTENLTTNPMLAMSPICKYTLFYIQIYAMTVEFHCIVLAALKIFQVLAPAGYSFVKDSFEGTATVSLAKKILD